MEPDSEPGTSPTVLETFAVTGGTPSARRVGKVISVPDPTTVLMVPAAIPASRIAAISRPVTGRAAPPGPAPQPRRADRRVGRRVPPRTGTDPRPGWRPPAPPRWRP